MIQSLLYPCSSLTRRVQVLDGMWNFQFDAKSEGVAAGWAEGLPASVKKV